MFLDHRLLHRPYLQQELLRYLDQATCTLKEDAEPPTGSNELRQALRDNNNLPSWGKTSANFLRDIVNSMPNATEDELLCRYLQYAPSQLQFYRLSDRKTLLRKVARQEGNRWLLLPDPRPKEHTTAIAEGFQDPAMVEMGRVFEARWWEYLSSK